MGRGISDLYCKPLQLDFRKTQARRNTLAIIQYFCYVLQRYMKHLQVAFTP